MTARTLLAITMGDAAGIGPEIVARLFDGPGDAAGCFVVGDVGVMRRAAGGRLAVARIDDPADALQMPPRCIPVLQPDGLPSDLLQAPIGRVDARCGADTSAPRVSR